MSEVRFVTEQNCVPDRPTDRPTERDRAANQEFIDWPPPLLSFSACFVTHFDDFGLPGTSIVGGGGGGGGGREGQIPMNLIALRPGSNGIICRSLRLEFFHSSEKCK